MAPKRIIAWALFKTAAFTLVVPGTVGVLIPFWIISAAGGSESLPPASWRWIGVLPIAAGACIYFWCAFDFAVTGLGTPAPLDMPRSLVIRGLYRFVRNPMYVGVACLIVGQAILFASARVAVYVAFLWVLFHLFVAYFEEPVLRRKFGVEYEEYCRRVPRWLPRF